MPKKFYDPTIDGITQGLLGKWLDCRKGAMHFLNGWSSETVSPGMTFGTISHGCLELAYSDIMSGELDTLPSKRRVAQSHLAVQIAS